MDIALLRGSRLPALRNRIDVHVFARETLDLNREELAVGDRLSMGIYSPERTLVDVIGLRHPRMAGCCAGSASPLARAKGL
jgi:hypothetical protein